MLVFRPLENPQKYLNLYSLPHHWKPLWLRSVIKIWSQEPLRITCGASYIILFAFVFPIIEESLRNALESLVGLAFREWASDAKKCTILSSISLLQHLKAGGPNSPVRLLPVIWQRPPAETKSERNLILFLWLKFLSSPAQSPGSST